ncbi:MAG TPA: hypothetical protein VMY39_04655, partial [Planctomycetota bacterium]|nr:hypothetical protein [Planctomycetota bacterium]
ISIEMQGVWVLEDKDPGLRMNNDLIVTTRHRLGSRPEVDKVHFYKQEVPERTWVPTGLHPVVYTTDDFRPSGLKDLYLRVRVYDEDGLSTEEAAELEKQIRGGTAAAGVAFPAFAPFAGLAAKAGVALFNLIGSLDRHDEIIDAEIPLVVNAPEDQGYDLLQPGFLVCFGKDVDAEGLVVGSDKKLYICRDGGRYDLFEKASYAVLRIDRTASQAPDLVLQEKMATLLSQLEGDRGKSSASAMAFLTETFETYSKYRKLERLRELRKKGTLSDDEKALKDSLEKELKSDEILKDFLDI